jgi:Transcriptional regulator PadR-like family.
MKNKQGSNKRCFYKNEIYSVVLKLIILSKLKKQNPYAYNILTDLKRNSMMKKHFSLTEEKLKNDTYNTIKSLETSGYIKLISSKKNKKYYEVTKQGDEVLSSIKKNLC